jgi:hypothetical protein
MRFSGAPFLRPWLLGAKAGRPGSVAAPAFATVRHPGAASCDGGSVCETPRLTPSPRPANAALPSSATPRSHVDSPVRSALPAGLRPTTDAAGMGLVSPPMRLGWDSRLTTDAAGMGLPSHHRCGWDGTPVSRPMRLGWDSRLTTDAPGTGLPSHDRCAWDGTPVSRLRAGMGLPSHTTDAPVTALPSQVFARGWDSRPAVDTPGMGLPSRGSNAGPGQARPASRWRSRDAGTRPWPPCRPD